MAEQADALFYFSEQTSPTDINFYYHVQLGSGYD